jgi:hypothetical protein
MPKPADIILHSGMSLLEAQSVAKAADMYLIGNGYDIRVSPIIPPGWYEIPIKVMVASPTSGRVCTGQQVAA